MLVGLRAVSFGDRIAPGFLETLLTLEARVEASVIQTDPSRVTVILTQGVDLNLLELLLPGEDRIIVRGRASGSPRHYP